jgi:hypothetical protein
LILLGLISLNYKRLGDMIILILKSKSMIIISSISIIIMINILFINIRIIKSIPRIIILGFYIIIDYERIYILEINNKYKLYYKIILRIFILF